jgi:hypothetical protein
MDQAALEDKVLLGVVGECREIANMDCHIGVCPGGHRKEAIHAQTEPLRNPTGAEYINF